jgi:hypothetical protein
MLRFQVTPISPVTTSNVTTKEEISLTLTFPIRASLPKLSEHCDFSVHGEHAALKHHEKRGTTRKVIALNFPNLIYEPSGVVRT